MEGGWFSGITKVALRSKEAAISGFRTGFLIRVMKRVASAIFTCIFALGGAMVGVFIGVIKGQTTETGFLNGAVIGAVTGALSGIQLLESAADSESLSKTALLVSIMNGKVFMEWVCPAVLKAYQWQIYMILVELEDYPTAASKRFPCISSIILARRSNPVLISVAPFAYRISRNKTL
ncbi:NEP1-interacting protein 2-like isoform X2 [Carya illinoinensis]|uniref:NEP1-interacting protein 2-like isoform X2 n=1 Tax=Carya illinoinensis TaxID=32201 RepID=UPI001C71F1FC|nr:NEP1-interacting protein 2-like isoform X2 [Carya illinoinensis]